tara:strand:+ start:123 stop:491 length:369 start_codon:yes stop_codon:yes gene_type:complete
MSEIKSFDELLGTTDLAIQEVDTSEWWGGSVFVRELDSEGFGIFIQLTGASGKSTFDSDNLAVICALSMCDKSGKLLVERKGWKAAAKKMSERNFNAVSAVAMAALEVSNLTNSKVDEAGKD